MERRLAAILAADVVGYSRLMEADEADTLAALKGHRKELIDPEIAAHSGRMVKLMGDGALVEFSSVVDALACAVAIQKAMRERNQGAPEDRRIDFRIGVHLGDIIVEGEDLYGDGVNVAARLEGLAEPGGVCISQQTYDHIGTKLDLGYEDLGEQQVKNIARSVRAYRVVLDGAAPRQALTAKRRGPSALQVLGSAGVIALIGAGLGLGLWRPWAPDIEPVPVERMAFPLPEKPSIAVLPFDNLGGDPEQDYFTDGITEDLITDLSKVSGLFVIARHSSFAYKGKGVDVRDIAQDLGVRYVLEGSVRRAGDQVRINAQLIDATTGGHLWAERYDGALTDVFALQDQVTRQIVAALSVTLTPDEQEGLSRAAKVDPEAYDLVLQAQARVLTFTREPNAEARDLYQRAVALDASFARAHAGLALTHANDFDFGWTERPEEAEQMALRHARAALALDSSDPLVHFVFSMIHNSQGRLQEAVEDTRRAVALDPNYADGYAAMGSILAFAGEPERALEAIRKAMRLSPRHGFMYPWILSRVYFVMGRYDEAIVAVDEVLKRNPSYSRARLLRIAINGLLGRIDETEWDVDEVLTARPDFSLTEERQLINFQRSEDRDRYVTGLRKAGLPE